MKWKAPSQVVTLPVIGLTHKSGQDEPKAETNKRVDRSDNPEFGSDAPGGFVENSPNHSYDHNDTKAHDGAHLWTADTSPSFTERNKAQG